MTTVAREALVAVGSNLGDRQAMLVGAVAALRANGYISDLVGSSIYETAPVGVTDQPKFLNAVIGLKTTLSPEALLRLLLDVEHQFGRERHERWGPRTLDLDLLAYENETRDTAVLQLPHPRMFERAFVLVPLRELLNQPRFQSVWHLLSARFLRDAPAPEGIQKVAPPECLQ